MNIYGRFTWGARHGAGFGPAPLPATEVWLHHSVTETLPASAEFAVEAAAMRTLESIGERRFGGGISYTFAVFPSGRVFEGHGVGREGAHTKGHNSVGRAILLVGNYQEHRPTDQQIDAAADLLAHGHRAGWWTSPRLAGGHRDVPGASTLCPGRWADAVIPAINARASQGAAPPVLSPRPPSPRPMVLRFGSTDPEVRRLQEFMVRVFPSYNRYTPTSYYGTATTAGIREFQERVGIGIDGATGPQTRLQLARFGYDG